MVYEGAQCSRLSRRQTRKQGVKDIAKPCCLT
jgi:hypothetical protein